METNVHNVKIAEVDNVVVAVICDGEQRMAANVSVGFTGVWESVLNQLVMVAQLHI